MFRDMRRFKQLLSKEDTDAVLLRGTSGVLALSGDDGYPYAVPVSYVYDDNKIIFHSAGAGHKADAMKNYNKASFCVVDEDTIVPEEFTTYFRSVIAFGKIRELTDDVEKRDAIVKVAKKYTPDPAFEEAMTKEIDMEWKALHMFALEIEHVTGKEAIEFVREKNKK